jgi:hypothetical protein
MSINNKLLIFAAAAAVLAVLPLTVSVDAKPKRYDRHYARKHYDPPAYPLERRAVDGSLVDRQGWRLRPGYGWDNTCFNLDYLASQFACTGGGRR